MGLALQELLGNLIGGVAVHADGAIREGVWIKTDDATGRVIHIRLRHTSIETADGDIVIFPNSALTKSTVTVLGQRRLQNLRFRLGAEHRPAQVIPTVESALSYPLQDTAPEPPPKCYAAELGSDIEYVVQICTTAPGNEEAAISGALGRIYYALERAGMRLAAFPDSVETQREREEADRASLDSVMEVVGRTPIWSMLTQQELGALAARARRVVYCPGEPIVRQGDEGSSMFIILRGAVSVVLGDAHGHSQQVATIGAGGYFGEMSLLTGDPRTATVMAVAEVECVELQKDSVSEILRQRPDLVNEITAILEKHLLELASVREQLNAASVAAKPFDLLGRIQRYFSLDRWVKGAHLSRS